MYCWHVGYALRPLAFPRFHDWVEGSLSPLLRACPELLGAVLSPPSPALEPTSHGLTPGPVELIPLHGARAQSACLRRENDSNGNCVLDVCE